MRSTIGDPAHGRIIETREPGHPGKFVNTRSDCGLHHVLKYENLRLPHSRAFGDGLFELRPKGRSGIGRAFYGFVVNRRVVVLHAFVKKSQQTPDRELKLARKRLKEVIHDQAKAQTHSS